MELPPNHPEEQLKSTTYHDSVTIYTTRVSQSDVQYLHTLCYMLVTDVKMHKYTGFYVQNYHNMVIYLHAKNSMYIEVV